jgi:hypothetical protein
MPRLRLDRSAIWLLVLVAHGLAWMALRPLLRGPDSLAAPRVSMSWRVLAPQPPPAEPSVPTAAPGKPAAPAMPRPDRSVPLQPTSRGALARPAPAMTTEAAPALPRELHEAPLPVQTPPLDPDATRRAIRESARSIGSIAQQAVEAGATLRGPTASQRLSTEVQQAGRGDCAKGEYAGGGMGLLSLPFLAAAAIHGDCAK